jgi:hypothetical protein
MLTLCPERRSTMETSVWLLGVCRNETATGEVDQVTLQRKVDFPRVNGRFGSA